MMTKYTGLYCLKKSIEFCIYRYLYKVPFLYKYFRALKVYSPLCIFFLSSQFGNMILKCFKIIFIVYPWYFFFFIMFNYFPLSGSVYSPSLYTTIQCDNLSVWVWTGVCKHWQSCKCYLWLHWGRYRVILEQAHYIVYSKGP